MACLYSHAPPQNMGHYNMYFIRFTGIGVWMEKVWLISEFFVGMQVVAPLPVLLQPDMGAQERQEQVLVVVVVVACLRLESSR